MDFKIELILVPVTDVDRAVAFYAEKLGWNIDGDHGDGANFRVVQLTPPGSSCSISVGTGITDAEPGALRRTHIAVTDIVAAHAQLAAAGVDVSPVMHFENGQMVEGVDPDRADYGSFVMFEDPDGNTWALQEIARRGGDS